MRQVERVGVALDRWWGIATIRAKPLSEHEAVQVAAARGGDFTGLQTAAGNWPVQFKSLSNDWTGLAR